VYRLCSISLPIVDGVARQSWKEDAHKSGILNRSFDKKRSNLLIPDYSFLLLLSDQIVFFLFVIISLVILEPDDADVRSNYEPFADSKLNLYLYFN
jgi:hypothetical protein